MNDDGSLADSFISSLYKPPALLPIARHRESIQYAVEQNQITIIVGQTGSGKSTQIPQFLDQAGWCSDGKVLAITQVGQCMYCSFIPMMTRSHR